MPQPMPPQGGPPQSAPSPNPGAGGPPAAGGIDVSKIPIAQLIMGVDQAIDRIAQTINQAKGASPQEKQLIGQIDSLYGELMQSLGQSAPAQHGAPSGPGAQGQTVPPEAGGNKGAIPSPM